MSSLLARTSQYRVNNEERFSTISRYGGRVVGGQDAVEGQFPFIVSMRWAGFGHYCGGFIISSRFAGTAAHCLEGDTPEDYPSISIGLGELSVLRGQEFPVARLDIIEGYNVAAYADLDAGIIEIIGDFLSVPGAQVVPLNHEDPAAGTAVHTSGWGRLTSGGVSPEFLQYAEVNIVDREECLAAYIEDISIK